MTAGAICFLPCVDLQSAAERVVLMTQESFPHGVPHVQHGLRERAAAPRLSDPRRASGVRQTSEGQTISIQRLRERGALQVESLFAIAPTESDSLRGVRVSLYGSFSVGSRVWL